jgi:hypothetical protein
MNDKLNLDKIRAYAAAGRQCMCCGEDFECLPDCTALQDCPREHETLEAGRDDDRTILRLVERVTELETLIRSRCEHYCADFRPYKRHAPECLAEEVGL